MQAAFDEFVLQMNALQKNADDLVRESLKKIDAEKIAAALAEVKKAAGR